MITLIHSRKITNDPPLPPADTGVDVFIPTLNEELALLRRTVRRAIAIRFPHRTWLLDDGDRPEVKALAAELGCEYITRQDRPQGGKAGNLNAALRVTSAPFVLVLDADALAHETILERTLGYFRDPQLAFVQTPQVYSNVDAFEVSYDPVKRTYWSAADLFHYDLQHGFVGLNAALCVGSGFIFRRSAVVSVGGFRTQLAGEDVQLSLDLHTAGWRSLYIDEVLALHLAPDGLGQYWTQHRRWARGTQHLLQRLFFSSHLSPAQWLVYGQVASGYLLELLRVLLRIVPALGAAWGVSVLGPGYGEDTLFVSVYVSWLVIARFVPVFLSNGRMWPTIRNAFTLLRAGPALAALWYDLIRQQFRFIVTPKGAGARAPLAAYGFPVTGVVIGGLAAIVAIRQFALNPNFALLAVAYWNVEFLILGLTALWIVRDRTVSRDVDTIVVQRKGVILLDGDHYNNVPLEIIRLGVSRAIAIGPRTITGESGVLKFTLDNEEYELRGVLRRIPNGVLPPINPQRATYDFAFSLCGPEHDRLADQIDGRELWRFFGSLSNYPYKLPPAVDRIGSGMAYYPLRPRIPSFRY